MSLATRQRPHGIVDLALRAAVGAVLPPGSLSMLTLEEFSMSLNGAIPSMAKKEIGYYYGHVCSQQGHHRILYNIMRFIRSQNPKICERSRKFRGCVCPAGWGVVAFPEGFGRYSASLRAAVTYEIIFINMQPIAERLSSLTVAGVPR